MKQVTVQLKDPGATVQLAKDVEITGTQTVTVSETAAIKKLIKGNLLRRVEVEPDITPVPAKVTEQKSNEKVSKKSSSNQ